MSEFPSQAELVRQQLEHDSHQRRLQRATDIVQDGNKGLAVLNSGAALTMLAFFGSLAEKAQVGFPRNSGPQPRPIMRPL
jgi:hypothetical protein